MLYAQTNWTAGRKLCLTDLEELSFGANNQIRSICWPEGQEYANSQTCELADQTNK
ncbi:hypothetical protein Z949_73 [Sulfitobacter guttiformis KCTC 32187]|nr:hypothetical protein Z949_73 [Sulfitobacter guttiformis KCTC 32187]